MSIKSWFQNKFLERDIPLATAADFEKINKRIFELDDKIADIERRKLAKLIVEEIRK